jgi:prepilin-type processing-associated H-X9-DG protein
VIDRHAARRLLQLLTVLCPLLLAACPQWASADEDAAALERNVKAAFIYKFAAYVEWPSTAFADAESPIVIGVAGDDAMAAEVARITASRQIGGRPFTVRQVGDADSLNGLHILFVARADSARLGQFVKVLQSRPTLVVTDGDGARAHGSAINFLMVDGRVRFNIANDEAEKRGIKLSSRLLSVAQNVQGAAQ